MTFQTPTTELNITGMTCGHCVKAVEGALKSIPGVQTVTVDLASGHATVQGDADTQAMLAAVTEEGYAAQVAGV
ncbi:cation transporter [Deinococcus sp.]|uniref:CopZ family metallochaperone n=1 Tax=Deinococcus sp. TaxID=47478 RepID=UPI002869B348|nr:cation transporter [Deinococcus sp.]